MKSQNKSSSAKCLRAKTLESQNQTFSPFLKRSNTNKARLNTLESISPAKNFRKYTGDQFDLPTSFKHKLSPIKQYETKIKLSAESWIIHDLKNNKYKRGWKHYKISMFNGLLRVVVLFCYCKIIKDNQNLKYLKVRVNQECLREDKIKFSKKQSIRLSWLIKKKNFGLNNHTILNFYDVICGLILTQYEDLLDYCIIYCGYLIECQQNDSEMPKIDQYHFFQSKEKSQKFIKKFVNYCNFQLFPNVLKLQSTKFISNFDLQSTCQDMCLTFLAGLQNSQFQKIIKLRNVQFPIRYQVGLKFWQGRQIKFSNYLKEEYNQYLCYLVYKGEKNYQAIAYNKILKILIIIEDSKFSMADVDIKALENWIKTVTKPIVSSSKLKQKSNPSILESSPTKNKIKFPLLSITDNK